MERMATDLEALVIAWLDKRKIAYEFQSSLAGGWYQLGGAVCDFLFPTRLLAWRVHGEYWHTGVEIEAHDLIQKELLSGLGWKVIDLWGSDLEERLNETLTKALRGEEMLK